MDSNNMYQNQSEGGNKGPNPQSEYNTEPNSQPVMVRTAAIIVVITIIPMTVATIMLMGTVVIMLITAMLIHRPHILWIWKSL